MSEGGDETPFFGLFFRASVTGKKKTASRFEKRLKKLREFHAVGDREGE